MTIFVDSSVWFAAAVTKDRSNERAKMLLRTTEPLVTTDSILVETWMLLFRRYNYSAAERFWAGMRQGVAQVERVLPVDYDSAWAIGRFFADQQFSIVDRTSFSVIERLGVTRVASFDDDFVIYRFGRNHERAFEVLR